MFFQDQYSEHITYDSLHSLHIQRRSTHQDAISPRDNFSREIYFTNNTRKKLLISVTVQAA